MFRSELPRIYELRDLISAPTPQGAYLRDLDKTLADWPQKLKQFLDIEADLQSLDNVAWPYLKRELAPLLIAKHEKRGWQQLFDKLNQAKAYHHLVNLGCSDIGFVPEAKVKRQRTPDLEARLGDQNILCEVKTINVSDVETDRFHIHGVGEITGQLPEGFSSKFTSVLKEAEAQMLAYCQHSGVTRIAYVIMNFDDRSHEYADRYQAQIDCYLECNKPPDIEVVLDINPAFYSALGPEPMRRSPMGDRATKMG